MNYRELASILSKEYNDALSGDKVLQIHLFAIKFANEIIGCGESATKISEAAGIGTGYGTEISKGVRLANHVTLNNIN